MPEVTFENLGLCESEAVVILMRKGAKYTTFSGYSGHLTLCCAQSHGPSERKGLGDACFPSAQAPPPGSSRKGQSWSQGHIPNLWASAYAEARTRIKSAEPFYVGKNREILGYHSIAENSEVLPLGRPRKESLITCMLSAYPHSHRRRAGREQILLLERHGLEYSARGSSAAAPLHTQEYPSLEEGTEKPGKTMTLYKS